MFVIPKIKITEGKNLLLTSESISIEDGDSLYLWSTNTDGKTLFFRALFFYLTMSKKKREQLRKKNNQFSWDLHNKKRNSRRRSSDVLLLEINPAIIPHFTLNQNILLSMPSLNTRLKHKIYDYLNQFNLSTKQFLPAKNLSFSEIKLLELIRAIILLPDVLMIDDFDLCFHTSQHNKILETLALIQNNGTVLLASGKEENRAFNRNLTIENGRVVVL